VLPILERTDAIYWWTEGYAEPPAGEGRFRDRDGLVAAAFAEISDNT
jgi:hypothetical protein